MKKAIKNFSQFCFSSKSTKQKQWDVDDQLTFSSDTLEPRVLLNALAVDDLAIVSEDAVFDSTVDGLNGGGDESVRDNDKKIPFTTGGPDEIPVSAESDSINGLKGALGFSAGDPSPVNFNNDGTFQFDGTGSDVIQSLSKGEFGTFDFEYFYIDQAVDGDAGLGRVTLAVQGENDEADVDFGGPNYDYVANGNAVEFVDPLVEISDVDANDTYTVELVVAPANPLHTGALGMLFLASEGEDSAAGSLFIEGTLDEVNAAIADVRYKPANIDYADDLDPYKLKQHIDITVTEIAGGNLDGYEYDPECIHVTESIAVLNAEVDAAGEVVFNHYPIANNDVISFNEDGLVDYRTGNLLDNDTDAEGDAIKLTGLSFEGTPATPQISMFDGVIYSFVSDGDYGTLLFNEDGSYVYIFQDDVDFLAFGEQIKDEFVYTIQDSAWNDGKAPATLKVTINGTKDAPEFKPVKKHDGGDNTDTWEGPTAWGTVSQDSDDSLWYEPTDGDSAAPLAAIEHIKEQATPAPIELDIDTYFIDLDASDLHNVEIKGVYLGGEVPPGKEQGQFKTDGTYYDMLSVGETNNTDPGHRQLTFGFDADASALNYLDKGDELYLIYKVCVTDPKDCTATAYIKIKVTGTEDKPELWVQNNGTVVEGDKGDAPIYTTGILGIDGVDEDDQSTFLPNNNRPELVGDYGRLVIVEDDNGLESWKYILDNNSPAVQMLDAGDVAEDNFYLLIYDNGQIQYELDEHGEPAVDEYGKKIPCKVHVCIDIIGTDDEPKIGGDMVVWVAEGNVDHPTFTEGALTITDIDGDDNPTFATNPLQPGSGTGVGTYGEIVSVVQIDNPDYDPEDPHSPEFLEVYKYIPNQELIQFLAKGEELSDYVTLTAYDYTLKDEYGNVIVRELATKKVEIIIKGTNDGPEVTSDKATAWESPGIDDMGVAVTAAGTLEASDVDLSDEVFVEAKPEVGTWIQQQVVDKDGNVTYEELPFWQDIPAYDSVNADIDGVQEALLEMLTLPEGPVVAAGDEVGTIEWTFDSGLEGFDFLAKGEKLTITYNVCVIDSCGETADATITVHILGKNDRPDIFVGPHDSAMEMMKENFGFGEFGPAVLGGTHGGGEVDGDGYYKSGTLSVSDKDASDAVTAFEGFGHGVVGVQVESTNPIPPDTGLTDAEFLDMLELLDATTVIGVGETEGTLQWVFSTGRNFDFLGVGEELTLTYTIEVSDKHATDTQDVVIKIKGTNDRPELKNGFRDSQKFGYVGSAADAIDADDFNNNGTLVSDLLEANQEDVDVYGSLQGIAVQGFAFSTTTTGAEDWEYSTDGGATWTSFAADTSPENATVLDTSARVRFVPDNLGQNTGWAKLKYVLWDQTDGNPSGTGDVDSTDPFVYDHDGVPCGESAYGRDMLWFTVQVNAPANDPPTAIADTYTAPADATTLLGSVLDNDLDPDTPNSGLSASLLGTSDVVTMFADGTFTFDSSGLLPGQAESFQYVVSDGTSSSIGTVTVNIEAAEVVISGPSEVVIGKGDTFTASVGAASGLGPVTMQMWSVDGVGVSMDASYEFIPPTAGTFELTYIAMDAGGSIASGSITVEAVTALVIGGDLVIGGTDAADMISVNVLGSDFRVNVNGTLTDVAQADVTGSIIICGLDGDDDINLASTITANTEIYGGAGNDTIRGGGGADYVEAGSGDDTVYGRDGRDEILGQGGNDRLFGQGDKDEILTGLGNDFVQGGKGNDVIRGDGGADTLEGNAGNDTIFGGADDDEISGGLGDDEVYGQDGNDTVGGDAGDDYVSGGEGDDNLKGGIGDDEIFGMGGDDTILGQAGDDMIFAGAGNDVVSAGNGNDIVEGGLGDDELAGNGGDDFIYGEGGDDTLSGGNDDDTIFGGDGNDDINGNAGDDTMDGQGGDDSIKGVAGDDTLTGGVGIDILNGGAGIDTSIDVGETEILIEL